MRWESSGYYATTWTELVIWIVVVILIAGFVAGVQMYYDDKP